MINGDRLRKLRQEKGISADAAATALGMGKSQLLKYENEKTEPTTGVLLRLMDYYGVSADYLLGKTSLPRQKFLSISIKPPDVIQTMGLEKAVPWLKQLGVPITVDRIDVVELLHIFTPETVATFLKEMGIEPRFDVDTDDSEPPE